MSGSPARRTGASWRGSSAAGATTTRQVRALLRKNELWFIPVANPDGYEFTFDHERLWRKNLRDNNNDGQITVVDGVDPNRNFPNHCQ